MKRYSRHKLGKFLVATAIVAVSALAASAEQFVGSTVESRLTLAFKVDDAKAAALLPEGWAPLTLPQGPFTGANLIMNLIDRDLALDQDGKPVVPPSGRAAAIVVIGLRPDTPPRTFVAGVFEPEPLTDTYKNSTAADIQRNLELAAGSSGFAKVEDQWNIVSPAGTISVNIDYAGVPVGWSEANEALPCSAAEPDFNRIYRYDQLAGLIMNDAIGRQINGAISFEASGLFFGDIFAGVDAPVAAVTVPVYIRDIYLP